MDWGIISKIWLCLLIAAILGFIIGWLLSKLFGSKGGELNTDTSDANFDSEVAVWKKKVTSLEADLRVCHDRQGTMESELKAVGLSAAGSGDSAKLQAEIDALKLKLGETENERVYLLDRVKKAEAGETLTVVPMDQRDDLELINGVGPVLERMLYDMGIYFFKDIAKWDAAKIAEMNEKLPNFRGRIEREGWVESAKEEHFKKYGERL
jgi:predicted flap endonuclease-1-like 5' DNA nuclease